MEVADGCDAEWAAISNIDPIGEAIGTEGFEAAGKCLRVL
jgi:hypothetical protein